MASDTRGLDLAVNLDVTGQASVADLQQRLDALADAMGGELGAAAREAGARLREIGEQQAAIQAFEDLRRAVSQTAGDLKSAERESANFAAQIAQAGPPTAAQAGQLERLTGAAGELRSKLEEQRGALRAAETQLSAYGVSAKDTGLAQQRLRGDLVALQGSLQSTTVATDAARRTTEQLGPALEQSFKVLGVKSVQAVESEVKQLQAALAQIRNSPDVLPADKAASVAAFNARLTELRKEAQGTPASLQAIAPAAQSAGTSLADAATKAAAWAAALVGINSVSGVIGNLVATGSEFETLRVRLENLLGSTDKATAAFGMIKDLAATTPFEVTAMTEAFVKLTAMGMQPTEQQMRSLADVAANLGGGTETLSGVTTALGQAWAKSKLQGEEILQLAERGVPVWDALARSTGRSVPELQAMSEAGRLGRDVISGLIDELGRMNAGASDKLMNTYAGAVSNAKDALAEFFDMVSRSGLLEFLTQKVQDLLAEFERMKDTGELQAAAQAISDTFVQVATAVQTAMDVLVTFGPALRLVAEAAIALKVANMAGTLLGVASATVGAVTGMGAVAAASGTAAVAMDGAAAAGGRMATMLRVLRSLTGVGLVLGAVELAQEFLRAKAAAEAADETVRKMLESEPKRNAPKDAAAAVADEMDAAERATADMRAGFDRLVEKGEQADAALGKIGKSFDLATAPGIQAASKVLADLVEEGRVSAQAFQDAWANALKGEDLLAFEARAKQALEGAQGSAEQLAQALDAGLREAVRRAGGDFDVISGGMSRAAQSAVNDVAFLVGNLDALADKGADVGAALTLSLGKAINTADSQAALDALRAQIEAVRGALGDKVADGFLEQATRKAEELKAQLDKLTPGINSVAEAFKTFGLKTREELQAVADNTKSAYDTLKGSGQATADQLREAFVKAAKDATAANGGIAPGWVAAESALLGVEIQAKAAGKSLADMGNSAQAAGEKSGSSARGHEKNAAALAKVAEEAERARRGVDELGYATDKQGQRIVAGGDLNTRTGIVNFLKAAGVEDEGKARSIAKEFTDAQGNVQYANNPGQLKYGGDTISVALLRAAERITFGGERGGNSGGGMNIPGRAGPNASGGSTQTINLQLNGRSYGSVETDASGAAALQALMRGLQEAAGRSN